MDSPRYMYVPLTAPCRIKVEGVGLQSVWGLRIILCSSSFHCFIIIPLLSNTQPAPALAN